MKQYNSNTAKLLARNHKLSLRDIPSKTEFVTIKDVKTAIKRKSKSKFGMVHSGIIMGYLVISNDTVEKIEGPDRQVNQECNNPIKGPITYNKSYIYMSEQIKIDILDIQDNVGEYKILNYPKLNRALTNFSIEKNNTIAFNRNPMACINCHSFANNITSINPEETLQYKKLKVTEDSTPNDWKTDFTPQYIYIYYKPMRMPMHSLVVLNNSYVIAPFNVCSKIFIQTWKDAFSFWFRLVPEIDIMIFNMCLSDLLKNIPSPDPDELFRIRPQ